eukprot:CAMPEP_0183571772 /NCGR_PEP_ID=MMETSP0371-20130417/126896_1 /TAXON_ID=268820 /ORGANISM="Peridinium aciculiferum, Strain PAER-2" /LENGTH=31 /DNA_ID= /DNA_START= /DNA_END= /DNA_ORIENTATION=
MKVSLVAANSDGIGAYDEIELAPAVPMAVLA